MTDHETAYNDLRNHLDPIYKERRADMLTRLEAEAVADALERDVRFAMLEGE